MIEQEFEDGLRVTSADVADLTTVLRTLGSGADGAGELVDQIRSLEELKGAAAAAQARVTSVFATAQRSAQRAAGVPAGQMGKGIAAQVALARRDSPARGSQHLGLAEALTNELPHTLAALDAGQISEWRATLIARETACLSVEHRRHVDAELAARPGGMGAMGDRAIAAEARRVGYRLDPHAVTDRARKAASDRRVTLRPAPDTMSWLGALLPAAQGVAAYAALSKYADSQRSQGDERTRGQIMADTVVERITGQASATAVPVQIQLVMTDRTLLAGDAEPAELEGHGPLPAPLVRGWLRGDDDDLAQPAEVWLRRLYTAPETGGLIAMDSPRRCFDGRLRQFVITADRRCRIPWCDAPVRHVDHPVPVAQGGETTAANSQGLCEACNYTKESHGWRTILRPDRIVETITPTGHRYRSRPPPVVGQGRATERASPKGTRKERPAAMEQLLRELLHAAYRPAVTSDACSETLAVDEMTEGDSLSWHTTPTLRTGSGKSCRSRRA